MTPPGQDTNPSQVSPQQKLVRIYTAESTGTSTVKYLAQGDTSAEEIIIKLLVLLSQLCLCVTPDSHSFSYHVVNCLRYGVLPLKVHPDGEVHDLILKSTNTHH